MEIFHRARANAYQQEAQWRLGLEALERSGGEPAQVGWGLRLARLITLVLLPGALDRVDQGGSKRFPYAEIRRLRLSYAPTDADQRRHRCDIWLARGEHAMITSTHYVAIWEFEDRAATYRQLTQGLIARVARANPACEFFAGKSPVRFWGEFAVLVLMTLALIGVLVTVGRSLMSAWVAIAPLAGAVPLLVVYARKNRPRRFSPKTIPRDIEPDP